MEHNEIERDTAVVKDIIGDDVFVEVSRKGSCKNCSVNMLCMKNANKVELKVKKPSFSISQGDEVFIEISPADRIFSSLIIFIFPIVVMVIFYFLIRLLLGFSEDVAIFGSLFSLVLSGIIIKIVDKKATDRIIVKITGKVR